MDYTRNTCSLKPVGRFLAKTGSAKIYANGDSVGFVWRWWHPLSWVFAPTAIIISILMQGIPETLVDRHHLGFGLSPWLKANPDQLHWIPYNAIPWSNHNG